MFEDVATGRLLDRVRAYDFDADPVHENGAIRIDAIRELDRVIREAQAEQAAQIAALHADRTAVMTLGRGDPSFSRRGAVGWRGPATAARRRRVPSWGWRWVWAGCGGGSTCSRVAASPSRWSGPW